MLGAFLGAALINLLQQSLLRWPVVSAFLQDAILGVLILLAVASDKVILERLRTRWVRARRDDERAAAAAAEQAVPGA
jgi:rhamnose transport system permease protein